MEAGKVKIKIFTFDSYNVDPVDPNEIIILPIIQRYTNNSTSGEIPLISS